MKESYRENLASCSGLEPYAGEGNVASVASARGSAGQPLSSEIITSVCRSCPDVEKATTPVPLLGEALANAAESENLCMCRHSKRENREIPSVSESTGSERSENVTDGNTDVYADGKSDGPIVPAKRTNKTGTPAAESVEERGSPKGKALKTNRFGLCAGQSESWLRVVTAGRDVVILTVIPKGGAV